MRVLTEADAMADAKIWAILDPVNEVLIVELWNDARSGSTRIEIERIGSQVLEIKINGMSVYP